LIQFAKFQKVNVIRKNNNNAAIDDNYLKFYDQKSHRKNAKLFYLKSKMNSINQSI